MTATEPDTYAVVETGETVVVGNPSTNRNRKPFPVVTIAGQRFVRFYSRERYGSEPLFGAPCGGNCTEEFNGTAYATWVYGGVCFTCNGSGFSTTKVGVKAVVAFVKSREARVRRAERKRVEREAQAAAARAAFEADNADLLAALAPFRNVETANPADSFLVDLANRYTLSPAQIEAAWAALGQYEQRAAAEAARKATERYAGPVGAKVTVTGTVAVATSVDTAYGLAALVVVTGTGDDDGVTVKAFGSGKSLWEVARGDVVTVTATVKGQGTYDGVAQTEVTRARFVVVSAAGE